MSNNILLYSVIILSLLFIIIMILLLVYPELYDYLLFLSSVILIIISILSFKCIDNKKCKCGKGEYNHDCPINGGINLDEFNLKKDSIIKLINASVAKNKDNKFTEEDANNAFKVLTELGIENCNQQQDASEFLFNIFGDFMFTKQSPEDNILLYSPPEFINLTDDKKTNIESIEKIKNTFGFDLENNKYELIGLINHSGALTSTSSFGHYTAFVKYKSGWYYCNDYTIEKLNEYDNIFDKINSSNRIKFLMYAKKNNLNDSIPPELYNFGPTCYSNSALQIILASGVLNNNTSELTLKEPKSILDKIVNRVKSILSPTNNIETEKKNITKIVNELSNLPTNVRTAIISYVLQNANKDNYNKYIDIYYYFYKKHLEKMYKLMGEIPDVANIIENFKNQFKHESLSYSDINQMHAFYKDEITNYKSASITKATIAHSNLIKNQIQEENKYDETNKKRDQIRIQKNKQMENMRLENKQQKEIVEDQATKSYNEEKLRLQEEKLRLQEEESQKVQEEKSELKLLTPIPASTPTLAPVPIPASVPVPIPALAPTPVPVPVSTPAPAPVPVSTTNGVPTKSVYSSGLPSYEVPFKQIQEYWENKSSKKHISKPNKLTEFDIKFGNN